MAKYISFLLLIIFILLTSSIKAQKYLLLKKIGSKKRQEFYIGDEIKFKLKNDKEIYKEEIQNLHFRDSLIVFPHASIHLNDIKTVYLNKRANGLFDITGNFLILAGSAYLIADTANALIGGDPLFVDNVLNRSGTLITAGVFLKLLKKHKYKIRGNVRLLIIDI